MATRGRAGSQKKPPKEKIVQLYESVFRGEDVVQVPDTFWHELLLLRPHVPALIGELSRLSSEQLQQLQESLQLLSLRCRDAIAGPHMIQCAHALQTLAAVMAALASKARSPSDPLPRPLQLLCRQHEQLTSLWSHCSELLLQPHLPDQLKQLCLQLLLAAAVLLPADRDNPLLDQLVQSHKQLLPALLQLLASSSSRTVHGRQCVSLLTVLLGWRRGAAGGGNECRRQVSLLEDELTLNGVSQVITTVLTEFNWRHGAVPAGASQQLQQQRQLGWLSSITSAVSSVFSGALDSGSSSGCLAPLEPAALVGVHAVLLALYELVLLNHGFLATLTQAATDASHSSSPLNSLDRNCSPPSSEVEPLETVAPPANLLAALVEFCSLVMRHTDCPAALTAVRLCFSVLRLLTEDQFCNSLLHDVNLVFSVQIHRMPMRHRRLSSLPVPDRGGAREPQPLSVWLLELCVEFLVSHLLLRLPVLLYDQCLGLVHRLLCYQKHCRVRLAYSWPRLWAALVALLRFVVAHEKLLCDCEDGESAQQLQLPEQPLQEAGSSGAGETRWSRVHVLSLCTRVVNVFNMFITYGDTFLATPASYDQLYYELVRDSHVFSGLYALAVRHRELQAAVDLSTSLVNIRAIGNHFVPRVDAWLADNGGASASELQVLELVRANYESLTLKLQQGLAVYPSHSENPALLELLQSVLSQAVEEHALQLLSHPLPVDHCLLTAQLSHIN